MLCPDRDHDPAEPPIDDRAQHRQPLVEPLGISAECEDERL
jgi:hypothetical protein